MNEHDLERLVNLLSYLKKHDDVESEIGKGRGERRPLPGERKATNWERWQTGKTSIADPLGGAATPRSAAKRRGHSTAAGGSADAYQIDESRADPNFPSALPDPSTQEIQDRPTVSDTSSEGRDYSPGPTFHVGEKGGEYVLPGEREAGGKQAIIVSPSDESSGPMNYNDLPDDTDETRYRRMQEDDDDTSDDSSSGSDWLNDDNTRDWLKENNINSFSDLQEMFRSLNPKVKGPGDYSRPAEQVKKSSESIILSLLGRLGI